MATRRTILLAVLAIVLVCGVGFWIAQSDGTPFAVDSSWHALVGVAPGGAGFTIATTLSVIGSAVGVSVCIAAAAVWLVIAGRRLDALALAVSAGLGVACSELLKFFVARPRPFDGLIPSHGFSYPSGHSMGAAVLATGLALVCITHLTSRQARALANTAALSWVAVMMWSRTALHVPALSDTISGALLGWAVAVLTRAALARLLSTRSGPKHPPIQARTRE